MLEGTSTMLRKAITAAALTACLTGSAFADTLLVDSMKESATDNLPQRGQEMTAVSEDFGSPVNRNEAVGEPPISSWEYADYVVFFENDRVLHTVAKR
jgi:hypothetical protein